MADPCDLQTNCPQGYLDKTGFMFLMAQMAMSILGGNAAFASPEVALEPEVAIDVPDENEDVDGIELFPADPDRYTGWIQNISTYTIWVSHSPDPTENETTRILPGETYQLGVGWRTTQALYAKMYGNPGQVARVIFVEGALV